MAGQMFRVNWRLLVALAFNGLALALLAQALFWFASGVDQRAHMAWYIFGYMAGAASAVGAMVAGIVVIGACGLLIYLMMKRFV